MKTMNALFLITLSFASALASAQETPATAPAPEAAAPATDVAAERSALLFSLRITQRRVMRTHCASNDEQTQATYTILLQIRDALAARGLSGDTLEQVNPDAELVWLDILGTLVPAETLDLDLELPTIAGLIGYNPVDRSDGTFHSYAYVQALTVYCLNALNTYDNDLARLMVLEGLSLDQPEAPAATTTESAAPTLL